MHFSNSIEIGIDERFAVGQSSLAGYLSTPSRIDCGVIMICHSGSARLTIDVLQLQLCRGSEIVILPGKIISADSISSDFSVDYVVFRRDMFEEASFRLDIAFFKFLSSNPFYQHNDDTIDRIDRWVSSVERIYLDREHMFRDTIVRNLLQNVFLSIYDSLRRRAVTLSDEHKGRQGELFHRYMTLVRENFREHHNVSYYAAKMCITTRYLSTIVRSMSGESPKDIIDHMIVLEARVLLRSTNMSVQEIAIHLHFPDQSYLGRYFRKHTGESPTEYRNQR